MGFEFDENELFPCDICGEWYPREEMYDLKDGRIVCPDCYDSIVYSCHGNEIHKCCYCGKEHPLREMYQYEDGRIVCQECYEDLEEICRLIQEISEMGGNEEP